MTYNKDFSELFESALNTTSIRTGELDLNEFSLSLLKNSLKQKMGAIQNLDLKLIARAKDGVDERKYPDIYLDKDSREYVIYDTKRGVYYNIDKYDKRKYYNVEDKLNVLDDIDKRRKQRSSRSTLSERKRVFLTRAVNDAMEILQDKFNGYKIKYINFNDYNITKKVKIMNISVDGFDIKYFESPRQENVIFYDVEN